MGAGAAVGYWPLAMAEPMRTAVAIVLSFIVNKGDGNSVNNKCASETGNE
jgi:hypothetical protein